MATGTKRVMVAKRATVRKQSVQGWMDEQFAKNPGLKARVETIVQEMELEQELVRLRKERGFSQLTVAKLLGVSQPAVAKIESGKDKNLGVMTLTKYAAALGAKVMIKFDTNPGLQQAKEIGLNRRGKSPA
jgi:DNA-binding XRE family transcriptional regulator